VPSEAPAPGPEREEDAGALGTERAWEFVVQGQLHCDVLSAEPDFASKAFSYFPDEAVQRASSRGVAYVCRRGRRLDSSVPNQDDFLVARHALGDSMAMGGHLALYGVFDGHGPDGHRCAAFCRGMLPERLFQETALLLRPEETLREAFAATQRSLLQQPFDTERSGSTAVLALVLEVPNASSGSRAASPAASPGAERGASTLSEPGPGLGLESESETWLFVAHVGDSRVVLASHPHPRDAEADNAKTFLVTALTTDHRPENEKEAQRLQSQGGEVRPASKRSSALRVFLPGQEQPALALTRSFGVSGASACGVCAEPEVSAYRLTVGVDILLLLGSDGLFDFGGGPEAVSPLLRAGSSQAAEALQDLVATAQERWASSSINQTVDDATAVAVWLPSSLDAGR
jgi:serine/threonine protein phosphatase PrpC